MINYSPGGTFFHRLNGATKLFFFIVMTVFIIMNFDVRMMAFSLAVCAALVVSMKPNWKPLLVITAFMTIMAGVIGSLMIILIRPDAGENHVGGATFIILWSDRFYLTRELLWYTGAMYFKRLCSLSSAFVLVLSITPSELAAGLNALGLPYKACTVIQLAFRTIPDISRDFIDIKNSMMMRGAELDPRKANPFRRLKQTTLILVPLIMTSFDRVETIANAMDLRGFGRGKRRTWYAGTPPAKIDWAVRVLCVLLLVFCLHYIINNRIIRPPAFEYWSPWQH